MSELLNNLMALGQPDPGQATPSSSPAPQAPQAAPQGQAPGESPVSRAEFQALMAAVSKLAASPAPAPQAPAPTPTAAPAAAQGDEIPAWAKNLLPQIESLASTQAAQQLAAKKSQLLNAVLAGVPDQNRGLAALAVEGMLASSGFDLSKAQDLGPIGAQLRDTLVNQHKAIFNTPGSQYSALPARGDGSYDWSGVRSLNELSPEMLAVIPQDEYRRLASGGGGAPMTTRGSGGVVSFRPRNKF